MPAALRHDPVWVMRNTHRMFAHTFRGSSWKSMVGLEGSRAVFKRYRALRARERKYLDWPDPLERSREAAGEARGYDAAAR
jgi:hypothetical protein